MFFHYFIHKTTLFKTPLPDIDHIYFSQKTSPDTYIDVSRLIFPMFLIYLYPIQKILIPFLNEAEIYNFFNIVKISVAAPDMSQSAHLLWRTPFLHPCSRTRSILTSSHYPSADNPHAKTILWTLFAWMRL